MARKGFILTAVLVFALWGCAKTSASDFSADMVSKGGGQAMKGKIFVSQNNTRMEFAETISISRADKNIVWVLMPAQKTYMEQTYDPQTAAATREKVEGEIERQLIATEKIDGKSVKKYLVVYKNKGQEGKIYQWIADGLAMPIKTAAIDGSWSMEFKNVKTGKQPPDLFEIPAGYTKFSVGNMLGGAMSGALKGKFGFGQ